MGFFKECEAAGGVTYSNSYLLKKNFRWKGLLIEPIGEQFKLLKKYRKKMICENFMLASGEYSRKKIKYIRRDSSVLLAKMKSIAQHYLFIREQKD